MRKSFSLYNILLIVSLMWFAVPETNAQDLEVGLFGGAGYYLGDINPGKQFSEAQPAFGLIARYNATHVGVRLVLLRRDDCTGCCCQI